MPPSRGAQRREARTTTPSTPWGLSARACAVPARTKSELQLPACRGHSRRPRSAAAVVVLEAPRRQPRRSPPPSLGRVGVGVGSCPRHAPWTGPGRGLAARGPLDAGVWERGGGPGARGGPAQRHGDQARAGHEARHGRGGRGGRRLRRGPHRPR